MALAKEKLFSLVPSLRQNLQLTKVTIVGSGPVASTIAYTLLLKNISDQVVLIDKNDDRIKAEFQDLLYGSYFLNENQIIRGTTDFSGAKNSQIIIFAIDVPKIEGEDFNEFLQQNVDFYKSTVPNVVQYCSDAIFIVVSSTCDILSCEICSFNFRSNLEWKLSKTDVTWKLSGLPKSSIIGIGTCLETARFRSLIANKVDVAKTQIQGCWIVGEQLKNFPVWSSVCLAGIKLHDVNKTAGESEGDHEHFSHICKEMEKSKNHIHRFKQNSTWATALCCADLVKTILKDTNEVRTVAVMVKDHFGIDKEVFLSVPCALNSGGVGSFLNIKFNEQELKNLRSSSSIINEIQKGINF